MVDRDLVLAKVAQIERCLERIAEVRDRRSELRPVDVSDLVALNLQRAVQATIDLAAHVVAAEGLGLPDTLGATFSLLEGAGVIDTVLGDRLRRMVGFRNVAVHQYQALDPEILEAIVTTRLDDLRAFAAIVVRMLEGSTRA